MRNNTQRIYERLSRGEFLSVDSTDTAVRIIPIISGKSACNWNLGMVISISHG